MTWFKNLFRKRVATVPLAVEEPDEWLADDAEAWRQFLATKTGRKLVANMYYAVYQRALLAARKNEFENGIDYGQNAMVGRLMSMAEVNYYRDLEQDPDDM